MKLAVDLKVCQNIGQCSFTAPELFPIDEDGTLAFRSRATGEYVSSELAPGDADLAQTAEMLCPTQAIRVG